MRKLAFAFFLLTVAVSSFGEEIRMKYMRPSHFITMMFEGGMQPPHKDKGAKIGRFEGDGKLIPKGITLFANDVAGILTIEGPAKEAAEVKKFIELMDVEPRQITVEIESSCDVLNNRATTKVMLTNNRSWQMRDSTYEVDLALTPRINSDGSITIMMSATRSNTTTQMVFRLKEGKSTSFRLNETRTFTHGDQTGGDKEGSKAQKVKESLDDPEVILVIRASIVEKKTASSPTKR